MHIEKRNLPLNALRAFDAVGRHLHMRKAADELCVSHSAISQQIRKLEAVLGADLLERTNKGLQLTPAGWHLHNQISEAFDQLTAATLNATPDGLRATLRVGCPHGLFSNWLIPRIHSYLDNFPEFEIKIDAIPILPTEMNSEFDIIISYGKPQVSNERAARLSPSPLAPIATLAFIQGMKPPLEPIEIASKTLLHTDDGAEWRTWFSHVDAANLTSKKNLYFTGYGLVLDAVRKNIGVGLMESRLLRNDIEVGSLVVLSEKTIHLPEYYYIVRPKERHRKKIGRQFELWLQEQWEESEPVI